MKPTESEETENRIKEMLWNLRGHLFLIIPLLALPFDEITMHPNYMPISFTLFTISFLCYMKAVAVWHKANKWRIGK